MGQSLDAGESGITGECEVVAERVCHTCCGDLAAPFPCSELGILEAIASGGGPHKFECDGSRTEPVFSRRHVDTDQQHRVRE